MEPGGSMSHSQGLSNNHYPVPTRIYNYIVYVYITTHTHTHTYIYIYIYIYIYLYYILIYVYKICGLQLPREPHRSTRLL